MRFSAFAIALSALLLAGPAFAQKAPAAEPPVMAELQKLLTKGDNVKIGGTTHDLAPVRDFYAARQGKPAWTPDAVVRLMTAVQAAEEDGLNPKDFEAAKLAERLATAAPAEAEMLLTATALRYVAHLRLGRASADLLEDDWKLRPAQIDPVALLGEVMAAKGGPDFAALTPPHPEYAALKTALGQLRTIAKTGGWPKVSPGAPLKPGMDDPRIAEVRARLVAAGDLAPELAQGTLFDDAVVKAVQAFQTRHGLEPDGGVGRQTLAAMNATVQERIETVALNMERWRWLPRKIEPTRLVVNAAAAWLDVYKDGGRVMSMRTIVGDREHHTPAFKGAITSIVLNPTWTVPVSIANKEVLPKLQKNAGYLVKEKLRLVGFEQGDPMREGIGVDWKSHRTLPYTLRQDPGDDNALGRVKFNIPNPDDIYLHDTPTKKAFTKADRALSHGCVRVEMPVELANHLLSDQKSWTPDKVAATIAGGETTHVSLTRGVPVYIGYWTAFVDGQGVLQLRPDAYGRDQTLRQAIRRRGGAQVAEVTVKRN